MIRNFTILILLCLVTAAACGIAGGERKAAKLVSRADAERIMGVPMKLELEKFDDGQSSCRYNSADGEAVKYLQVMVREYDSEEQSREAHEMMRDLNRHYGGKIQPIEGVGDGAWIEKREYSQAIHARRKNVAFLIVADYAEHDEEKLAELRRVAAQVAERL